MTGELLKQAERQLTEVSRISLSPFYKHILKWFDCSLSFPFLLKGLHPRIITEGFDLAKEECLRFLDTFKKSRDSVIEDRELLLNVARTSLRTKLQEEIADSLTETLVDAIQIIDRPDFPLDLHMVEIMHMKHRVATDTRFVRGLVKKKKMKKKKREKFGGLESCDMLFFNPGIRPWGSSSRYAKSLRKLLHPDL